MGHEIINRQIASSGVKGSDVKYAHNHICVQPEMRRPPDGDWQKDGPGTHLEICVQLPFSEWRLFTNCYTIVCSYSLLWPHVKSRPTIRLGQFTRRHSTMIATEPNRSCADTNVVYRGYFVRSKARIDKKSVLLVSKSQSQGLHNPSHGTLHLPLCYGGVNKRSFTICGSQTLHRVLRLFRSPFRWVSFLPAISCPGITGIRAIEPSVRYFKRYTHDEFWWAFLSHCSRVHHILRLLRHRSESTIRSGV